VDLLDGPGGIPIASGLRVLEHIATLGAAALGKVPPFTPRSQPQICALWLRWGTSESGQHEEMSKEEANARFAAGRKVQAEKAAEEAREKAEKAAARQAARQAAREAREAEAREKEEKAAARQAAREAREAEEAREKEEKAAARQAARQAAREAREAEAREKAAARGAPLGLTAAQAIEAAVLEGLQLETADNDTGFKGVYRTGIMYQGLVKVLGIKSQLGIFATREEAALHVARHKAEAEAEAAAEGHKATVDLTAEQAIKAAALEGLQLVPADNDTGFNCVYRSGIKYQGLVKVLGIKFHLGIFATREEAALHVARHKSEAEYKAAAGAGMPGSSRKSRRS
jgi:hypothetical protein